MELQGIDEMATIQKFEGGGWTAVGSINAPSENLANVVWSFAEMDRGVAYRAVDIRKVRGKEEVRITELTPVLCATTIDVEYRNEFGEKPVARFRPNLR